MCALMGYLVDTKVSQSTMLFYQSFKTSWGIVTYQSLWLQDMTFYILILKSICIDTYHQHDMLLKPR